MKIIFVGWFAKQWLVYSWILLVMLPVLFIGWDIIDLCTKFRNVPMKTFLMLCMEWSFMLLSWTLFSSTSNCEAEEGWEHRTFWWNRPWRILRCMVLCLPAIYVGQCGIILVAAPIVFIWMVLVFDFGFPRLCARSRQKNDQIQGIMLKGRGSASLV